MNLDDGRIIGVEALVRWQHPRLGLIAPDEFLSVAEETGLITQVDEWVQARAFQDVSDWHRSGLEGIRLSVNISAQQLEQDGFVERFFSAFERSGMLPDLFKIEITENAIMKDIEVIVPRLRELRRRGLRIAIDDFGTGYSSLSYLQQFPVSTLKIDRSFVGDIRADQTDASIINAIVAMARGLKLDLIAEGVETRTQLNYLKLQGCKEVQGFIFSRPVPAGELKSLLRQNPFMSLLQAEAAAISAG